jgi:cell division protein FtsN
MNQQFSKAQVWQIIASSTIALGFFEILKFAYQAFLTVQSQFEQYDQLKEQLGKEATKPEVQEILQQSKLYYLLTSALVAVLIGLLILVIINRKNATSPKVNTKTTTTAPVTAVTAKKTEVKKTATKKPAAKKPAAKKASAKKTTKK